MTISKQALKPAAQILGAAVLYYAAARLSLHLAFENTNASPVWPPSGIALALVLLLGYRVWPGILLGAFLANFNVFEANRTAHLEPILLASAVIAAGNTLEALLGAQMLSRWGAWHDPLGRARGVFRLVLAAPLMCLASACVGPTILTVAGIVPWSLYKTIWTTWWLGDIAGVLVVTPLLVSWSRRAWVRPDFRRAAEATLLAVVLLIACGLAFGGWLGGPYVHAPLSFLTIPLLVWAAFRFGPHGASGAIALVSAVAIWATIHGRGPFGTHDVNGGLLLLQSFLAVLTATMLVIAATVRERTDTAEALRRAHDGLEARVRERTEDLARVNALLLQEVAERRKAEEVLQRSEARLAEAQELAHLGSWDWDVTRNETAWTDGMYRVFGIQPHEFSGTFKSFLERVHLEDQLLVRQTIERAYQDHRPFSFDYRIVRPDGDVRWVHGRGRVQLDDSGHPVRMLGTAQEITERRQAEDALRAVSEQLRQRNRTLEAFATVAAHELQEPLRKIQYFIERGVGDTRASSLQNSDVLERIRGAGRRMQSLVHDLLEIARLSRKPESVELVDLVEVAGEVVADLESRIDQLDARVEIGPLPEIEADRTQMRQLLQNLLGNALKFRRSGVRPTIRISSEYLASDTEAAPRSRRPAPYCRMVVEDNGIGFEPVQAERIFAVFERLHGRSVYEGTGIGLSICRKIADLHGGRIRAEGTPGQGARFIVVLPTRQGSRIAAALEGEMTCAP